MPDTASGLLAFPRVLEARGLASLVQELGRIHFIRLAGVGGGVQICGRIRTVRFQQRNHLASGSLADTRRATTAV